jgi:tetratricopeptide (TPR) repeat protein
MAQHRYTDAVRAFDRALTLVPDLGEAAVDRALTYLAWTGNLDTLRVALDRMPAEATLGGTGDAAYWRAVLYLSERDPDRVLALTANSRAVVFGGQLLFVPVALVAGWAHRLKGDERAMRSAFTSGLAVLDSAAKYLPDDPRVHASRGMALAGLGRRSEALREAEWLRRSEVYRRDALDGPSYREDRARILAQVGESAAALEEVERLLAGPSWTSATMLRLDPHWDSLRDHPRFKALLVKYADPERTRR